MAAACRRGCRRFPFGSENSFVLLTVLSVDVFTSATVHGIQLHLMESRWLVISWRCASARPMRHVPGGNVNAATPPPVNPDPDTVGCLALSNSSRCLRSASSTGQTVQSYGITLQYLICIPVIA
jgi:hypothetical protein